MQRSQIIALVLALAAAGLTYYLLTEKEAAIKADVTPIKVLVAKEPIGRGAQLTAEKVMIDEVPGAYIMPGAIASASREVVVKQWESYRGQFALVPIAKGEQVLPNKLSRILPGFAAMVPEGQRIAGFTLDAAAALGGHLRPGNRVDVVGTFEHQFQGTKRITSAIVVQNALVSAVGDQTPTEPSRGRIEGGLGNSSGTTICLAVSPQDAVRLTLAEREGSLKLVLRSLGDEAGLDLPDQNLGSLLGPLMKVRREEIKSAPRSLEIIRGTP